MAKTKAKAINVTVLVNESHKDNMTEVAKGLEGEGFVLKESLGAVGVLTGSVPAASLDRLARVPGVSAVEEERGDYRPQ